LGANGVATNSITLPMADTTACRRGGITAMNNVTNAKIAKMRRQW
jgi:hypothetical protein